MTAVPPMGIRNANPGNLRDGATKWQGQTGAEKGFCIFDTPENGLRAMCVNLTNYSRVYGLNTVAEVIQRWAPATENDTVSYIGHVSAALNVAPAAKINLGDPATLATLAAAIVRHENGQQPYPLAMILTAAQSALGKPAVAVPSLKPAAPTLPPGASGPMPKGPRPMEELKDVPPAELDALMAQYRLAGATTEFIKQPNGLYTVRATF